MIKHIAVYCIAGAMATMAQQPLEWQPPSGERTQSPKVSCSSLRSLTGIEYTIITATVMPAERDAPAFCRVSGQIQPEIRFEVTLPAQWNRRLLMTGNGGYAGDDLDDPRRARSTDNAHRMGFVTTRTNTGHDAGREPLGSFAVSSQKLFDYAYRAVHVTAETAKKVAQAYYGVAPERSYFSGCSTGGRQALMSAQRFPNDFDGIVAGAPVLDFSGTMVKYTSWVQAQEQNPISVAKVKMLADRVYAICDPGDGLKDGLIDDPRRCDFRPSRDLPRCDSGGGEACFTAGEIRTLESIYGDVSVNGKRRFPGWPLGAEVIGHTGNTGWNRWIVADTGRTISNDFAETFFRYLAYPKKDPKLTLAQISLDQDLKLDWIHSVLDATDTDLSGFRGRGGKLLMYFGWADQALNAMMGVEYYEGVLEKMGPATTDFFRLFMMPGVFHCGGGIGCDQFPRLATLIDWVEKSKVPDRLVAARRVEGAIVRTRPLCPYPQVARYKGSGSIDEAANFSCVAPGGK